MKKERKKERKLLFLLSYSRRTRKNMINDFHAVIFGEGKFRIWRQIVVDEKRRSAVRGFETPTFLLTVTVVSLCTAISNVTTTATTWVSCKAWCNGFPSKAAAAATTTTTSSRRFNTATTTARHFNPSLSYSTTTATTTTQSASDFQAEGQKY